MRYLASFITEEDGSEAIETIAALALAAVLIIAAVKLTNAAKSKLNQAAQLLG